MLTTLTMPKSKKKALTHIATADNDIKKTLCDNFKKLRLSMGLTQYEFGDELKVPRDYISAIEKGSFQPSHQIIYMVAEKYNLDINQLYGRIYAGR